MACQTSTFQKVMSGVTDRCLRKMATAMAMANKNRIRPNIIVSDLALFLNLLETDIIDHQILSVLKLINIKQLVI